MRPTSLAFHRDECLATFILINQKFFSKITLSTSNLMQWHKHEWQYDPPLSPTQLNQRKPFIFPNKFDEMTLNFHNFFFCYFNLECAQTCCAAPSQSQYCSPKGSSIPISNPVENRHHIRNVFVFCFEQHLIYFLFIEFSITFRIKLKSGCKIIDEERLGQTEDVLLMKLNWFMTEIKYKFNQR